MERNFYIKCNVQSVLSRFSNSPYLYWNGVNWVTDFHRARKFASEAEGRKELLTLSPPRIVDKKGPGPEVFEF
jgi:hypothetical protein